jgi:uncharacterized membrane protein
MGGFRNVLAVMAGLLVMQAQAQPALPPGSGGNAAAPAPGVVPPPRRETLRAAVAAREHGSDPQAAGRRLSPEERQALRQQLREQSRAPKPAR